MNPETTARWGATAAVVVTGGGLGLSVPWAVPPPVVWAVLFVASAGAAWVLWRRRFDERALDAERERVRPDRPYQQRGSEPAPDRPYQPAPNEPEY